MADYIALPTLTIATAQLCTMLSGSHFRSKTLPYAYPLTYECPNIKFIGSLPH